jgi:hypothetical protein
MSEVSKRGRGRPRKLEDVNPIVEHQKRINEEVKQSREKLVIVDEWYELKPGIDAKGKLFNKVIKRKKKSNGNKYSTYIGKESECVDLLQEWKAQGKLR